MLPIHPFPARMAPDVARSVLADLSPGSNVLDPMCGSGTVIRHGVELGHDCAGWDVDPLAVLMTNAWTTPISTFRIPHDALNVVERAELLNAGALLAPWEDDETEQFARYWFAPQQCNELMRLAQVLKACRYRTRDVLRIALSRVIVTKDRGASLARDVSHSRPHRVRVDNDFDVYRGFVQAARLIAKRLAPEAIRGSATVLRADARSTNPPVAGFDLAITSPPYLNAIDYLRGHRLSLIWFGYSLAELRKLRADATGAERSKTDGALDVTAFIKVSRGNQLGDRYIGWVRRYSSDMTNTLASLHMAVRPGGKIVLVVGNSVIRGAAVDNASLIRQCAASVGLHLSSSKQRSIPARRRYLPPPRTGSALAMRMRAETVLTFQRP